MTSFFDSSAFSSKPVSSVANVRVIPAQVNFLTIFNPSLGDTEESEGEQIVFWGSKADLLAGHARVGGRKRASRSVPETSKSSAEPTDDEDRQRAQAQERAEETNYRLRQIGLARGMVDFVKNFSNDKPVSSVETQKSRIILHEIEQGWWILASIDLTRLPVATTSQTQSSTPKGKKEGAGKEHKSRGTHGADAEQYEYSAREVAPPQLLLGQVLKAHRTFLLHHAATLWDLYHRLGKLRFTAHLQKFWDKFLWDWDVLLHGSPAVEVYGGCTKLAGGGELGIGVGEEEWGSGEREVLEEFVSRTEGCVDLVVGRYGDAPAKRKRRTDAAVSRGDEDLESRDLEQDVWLGNGDDPGPADGVIFSGVGTLSRQSLASVSQWMEAIFKYGEDAYGVGENPSARTRQRHKLQRPKTTRKVSDDPRASRKHATDGEHHPQQAEQDQGPHPRFRSPKTKAPDLRRQAIENSALPPGIPAPLVTSVERSLDEAIAKAQSRASSRSPRSSPTQEKSQEEAMKGKSNSDISDSGSSWFDADKMTKVFKLGYGTSWTLNPKGFGDQNPEDSSKKTDTGTEDLLLPEETTTKTAESVPPTAALQDIPSKATEDRLQEIDPTPEVSDDDNNPSKPFLQHLEKSIGRFIIGLSGDLENTEFEADEDDGIDVDLPQQTKSQRLFLRTLSVEVNRPYHRPSITSVDSVASQKSHISTKSQTSTDGAPKPKTSAAASVDGPTRPVSQSEKMQVAVYIHQPFIFVFLFSLHTPNLTMPGFYRGIHHQLGPLQIPLLKRTDPERVAERIQEIMLSRTNDGEQTNIKSPSQMELAAGGAGNIIYDLVYDPTKLTIRTSIPNIPVPTSFSEQTSTKNTTVSGSWYTLGIPIGSKSPTPTQSRSTSQQRASNTEQAAKARAEQWSRMDALNVHQQILNSYAATHSDFASSAPATMASTSKSAYSNAAAAPASSLLKAAELERTIKTNRGWWVLWMRVPPSTKPEVRSNTSGRASRSSSITDHQATPSTTNMPNLLAHQFDKEAFLVRKSADGLGVKTSVKTGTSSPKGSSGRWLLREQPRDSHRSSGASGSDGVGGAAVANGVSEGVGIDAKKWIDGLLSLTS